ncbi:hypothetical protein [Polyangium mundeleinium]|uniref:PEGA domain-containing protein n=1 Tax=Polyangium mundeleinium TaxID=2995306 RepID=A0ABT5ESF2_9BACT|nr:hypothetical protein [Polyangium mundeleinium]MDC0744755.1 hypothetical protein [Polyangium mundeleinium]
MRRYLVFCWLGFATALSGTSLAEPALPPPDVATTRAGQLYDEGLDLYGAERFSEAHAALVAAWSLKKHYQIAGVLGDCEMRLGKYRDAAEHLTYYVRDYPKDQPAAKIEQARKMLDEAKGHLGTLTIRVDEPGADVFVDGKHVGPSPLVDPVFVDPGTRLIEAQRSSGKTMQTVEVRAGSTHAVRLTLGPARAPVPPGESKGLPWAAMATGAGTAVSLGVGIGLLAMAGSADAEAAAYRREHGIEDRSYCAERPSLDMCKELHGIAVRQVPYFWGGVGALALAGVGAGVTTYLLVRPSGKGAAPRVGLRVSPGPYFEIRGAF